MKALPLGHRVVDRAASNLAADIPECSGLAKCAAWPKTSPDRTRQSSQRNALPAELVLDASG